MSFVIIGTDHRFQYSDRGLHALVRAFLELEYFEPLSAIAEEYHSAIGETSVGQRLAVERNLRWYNVDMTLEEKLRGGILEAQQSRPGMFQANLTYRIPSDDIREEAWVEKLIEGASGTTLVICGYLHCAALARKLRKRGYVVDSRIYLEDVPTIVSCAESVGRD